MKFDVNLVEMEGAELRRDYNYFTRAADIFHHFYANELILSLSPTFLMKCLKFHYLSGVLSRQGNTSALDKPDYQRNHNF